VSECVQNRRMCLFEERIGVLWGWTRRSLNQSEGRVAAAGEDWMLDHAKTGWAAGAAKCSASVNEGDVCAGQPRP